MTYQYHIKRIPLCQIDTDNTAYSLTPFIESHAPQSLHDSISRVGVLHPPILKEKYVNSFQIVTGRKRLQAVHETLSQTACVCLIIPYDTPELTVFSILLEDTLTARHLSPIEKAFFFQKVTSFLDPNQAAQQFLPRLGVSPNPFTIKKLLSLLDLEEPIMAHLNNGFLDEKVTHELAGLPFRDRMAVFEVILQLRLSIGKQKKLLTTIRELSARNKLSVADIISSREVKQILSHSEANNPQKSSNLMAWLTRESSPRLSEAEKKFRKLVQSLDLPKGADLTHSLSFEKDALTLSLLFKSEAELVKIWHNIKPAFVDFDQD